MSNPFVLAIKTDPGQFLGELDTAELKAVAEGCVQVLEKRAKKGDSEAPSALQSLYRSVANVEI